MCLKITLGKRLSRLALLAIVLLNALDALTTWYDLQRGAHEGNPLIAPFIAGYGFGALILYKLVIVLAAIGGTLLLERLQAPRLASLILTLGLLYFLVAVLFNIIGATLTLH